MFVSNWRSKSRCCYANRALYRRRRKFQPCAQTLESRSLLSVNPVGVTITPTEVFDFTSTIATFTATDAGPFNATIDWGDGTTDSGAVVANGNGGFSVTGGHAYFEDGTDAISVVIIDSADSTTATAASTGLVAEATTGEGAFSASDTGAIAAVEGRPSTFRLATFFDPEASDASEFNASIDWGDGITTAGTVSGGEGGFTVTSNHTYADELSGNYLVTISEPNANFTATAVGNSIAVTEGDTLFAIGEKVSEEEADFVPATSITASATEGATFSGALATFADIGYPTNVPTDFTASIDWGDGTTTAGTVGGSPGSFTVSGSHVYSAEGTATATAAISDNAPGTATGTATATIDIADAPLSATGTTISPDEGVVFSGTVANFTDADPNGTASDYTAIVNWGDGATSTGTIAAAASGGFSVSGSHSYADVGTHAIAITVTDIGGSTATATSTANITAPNISGTAVAVNGFERSPLTNVTVTIFTQGNGAASAGSFVATINWGDDRTTSGVVTETGTTYTVTGSHTYLDEGLFHVTVQVSGNTASATIDTTAKLKEELLPNGTQGTANERFIQEVYRDLLHRQVDPTALPYWSNLLDQGQTHLQVVAQIIAVAMPGELGVDLVTGMFERYLGRDPDAAALAFWVHIVSKKETIEDTESNIVGTPEFYVLSGGTSTGFITRLFNLALNRAPDPQALMTLHADLANGMTREQVAEIVFNSHEFHLQEVGGYFEAPVDFNDRFANVVPFVDDIDFLDRPADPAGLAGLTGVLDRGVIDQAVWAGMMASNEFFAKIA